MTYISYNFLIFLIVLFFCYYILPTRHRWMVLLVGSCYFYYEALQSWQALGVFGVTIAVSYLVGCIIEKSATNRGRIILWIGIVIVLLPLTLARGGRSIPSHSAIVPVGISFYTLQIIAYMVDIYKGKIKAQKNFLKYVLFISFFPQIIQGPIPRYSQIEQNLYKGNKYQSESVCRGVYCIIWGWFLKLMIADKAAVIVNGVFDTYENYSGSYYWIAAILYSIQLYADFLACVTISQGVAMMFGINIINNFNHPYFSRSIKEFWRRWHISLSEWLRDYIYIPLGGNRFGEMRKSINLIITFLVSGIWHGTDIKYILWGFTHAIYQIIGEITKRFREKAYNKINLPVEKLLRRMISMIVTFVLVTLAWVIFRADTLEQGAHMISSMLSVFDMQAIMEEEWLALGLSWKQCGVMLGSVVTLIVASKLQERMQVSEWLYKQNIIIRWGILLMTIFAILILGTYGVGYDAQDFIYRGF